MNEYHQLLVNQLRDAQVKQSNLFVLKPQTVTTHSTWGEMRPIFMSQSIDLDHALPMNEQTEAALIFVSKLFVQIFSVRMT